MKYKRKITSGALALTLFVGGSSAYAANIQGQPGTGISHNATQFFKSKGVNSDGLRAGQRGRHGAKGLGFNHNRVIGEVIALTSAGFTLEAYGPKHLQRGEGSVSTPPPMVPFDIKTTSTTIYQKDGASSLPADLSVGQKVIVVGTIDPSAQIVMATKVNIITRLPDKVAKGAKKAN